LEEAASVYCMGWFPFVCMERSNERRMTLQFTVLASGSGGNASLLEAEGFGVLLDFGLGPRQLADRLSQAGSSWQHVHAVVLTHTHSDHWKDSTLKQLLRRRIPLYCHASHAGGLQAYGPSFLPLRDAGLVRFYEAGEEVRLSPGLRCRPLPILHDGGATFGFRFEGSPDLFGHACSLSYAADLGCWTAELAEAMANVELLALEFNHDVDLEAASGRSPYLVARVLGDHGHLSNGQAAALLGEVLRRSPSGRLRYLVQLHLSRECNFPALAAEAARRVLAELAPNVELHTAHQERISPTLHADGSSKSSPRRRPARQRTRTVPPSWF
jgi:phosphoribosyl 1,2-cyclic phosphodiesterase